MTLTTRFVKTVEPDARLRRYRDGANGLMLVCQPLHRGGSKQWIARVQCRGRRTDHGLGSPDYVSLPEARKAAAAIKARAVLARHGFAEEAPEPKPNVPTFRVAANHYRELHAPRWRPNTRDTFDSNMRTHVLPRLGRLAVDEIHPSDVIACVGPLFASGKAAAGPARRNIKAILDMCKANNWIASNPADRSLDAAMARLAKPTRHHEAVPVAEAPSAYRSVSALAATSASLCLRYLMLTCVRSGEARGALWAEIDADTWMVPAARMKTRRDHAVPLSGEASKVLAEAKAINPDAAHVFRAVRRDAPLPDKLAEVLSAAGVGATAHGWRSTFRDWCEESGQDHAAAEYALAHVRGDKTEQAYQRSTLLEKRRVLMQVWADYLAA